MYKIAVIGESESIMAFHALGFDTFRVDPKDAGEVLKKQHRSGNYAVIFVSEAIAEEVQDLLQEYVSHSIPAIIVVPLGREWKHSGIDSLKKTAIRATGTDVISKLR